MKKNLVLTALSLFILSGCTTNATDSSPHALGNPDAKVTLQEFSDPQCPACGYITPQVEQFVKDNPDLVRLEYFHYPLSYHEYAFIAAEAAECAGDQGKFWEYLDEIYANQSSLNEDYLFNVADSLGLDRTAFDACVDGHKYKEKILTHMAEGSRLKLPGTPSFYIDGQIIKWSGPEVMKTYLESL